LRRDPGSLPCARGPAIMRTKGEHLRKAGLHKNSHKQ
jgi:hypothetical protein